MTTMAVPDYASKARRAWPWLLAALLLLASAAALRWYWVDRGVTPAVAGAYFRVSPMDLAVTIKKDGELQAVKNIDITCEVEGQSRIQTIVPEGVMVKKGDVMVKLDSAEIERKLQDAKVQLQKCEADQTMAREEKTIQDEKNAADLEAAQVELTLAELDLAEYDQGKYPQSLREAERAVHMAEITLKNKQEEKAQTQSLYLKGFMQLSEVKRAEVDEIQAQDDLDKKDTELRVLKEYTYQKELTDRKNKVEQAKRKLARTKKENASNLAQKVADVSAKEEAYKTQKYLVEHMDKQLAACTIKAPSDGLVVYGSTGSNFFYRERPIQAGSQVGQQELLIRLPDTSQMKAVVKIPESWISKVRSDPKNPMEAKVEIVGVPAPVPAKVTSVSVMADNSQRWWNPDAKEYPVELTLEKTPAGLKPGTSATAEIFIEKLKGVLGVPLGAVYSVGTDRYVFARERLGGGVRPLKVTLGDSNETHVEVKDGLKDGQEVLVLEVGQGRELLERAGIRVEEKAPAPTTRPTGAVAAVAN